MRIQMMGCAVDNLDMEESLAVVEGFIRSGRPHQHVVVNVDKIVKASRDPGLRRIINDCDLINADGMPVVWASRLLGKPLKERVTGVDLFEALMARAAQKGWRVFLLGAREEVVSGVARLYPARYPGLTIAGYRNGYWSKAEEEEVVAQISAARPADQEIKGRQARLVAEGVHAVDTGPPARGDVALGVLGVFAGRQAIDALQAQCVAVFGHAHLGRA